MYAFPVLWPETSNREDLYRTVSLFDDDTGAPINLSGTALGPGNLNGFTGSAWTVTDGAIVTPSATQITIPAFPIGNQLSALPLTVGANLGILAGDPILIADASGLNTMAGYVTSYVASTGALVCQIGLTFQFEIRWQDHHRLTDDYSPFYDFGGGAPNGPAPIISASLGNGLTIVDLGYLLINIPETKMRTLHHKTYLASLTMTDSVSTRQVLVGKLPILYGGVTL